MKAFAVTDPKRIRLVLQACAGDPRETTHATEVRASAGRPAPAGLHGLYAVSDGKAPATVPAATEERLAVYFSPKGGCTEAVVGALGKAKQTVLVQAYSFTSAPIAKALVDAHKRGLWCSIPG